ncbi:10082_t:CDS:2 [Racocetra fulgida]|uniref:10082_t:CDS:1 n=1 Tax=Racocetra fulgida TaxID=60492 RepID=A0A9N9BVL5_9GLOM|nr:10082_t:CDS:2 [Racocetra fulgida]
MSNGEVGKIHVLKQQVHTLRHDLAEKNALLTTVQKQLNRHQPNQPNGIVQSESTTGRVIENLQAEIDHLKKDLADSKTQIHVAKVSHMKFERDNASLKLRQSELKVSDLERKLQEALAGKEKAEYEYTLLSKEMQAFKTRYTKDVEIVKKEFKSLREEMNSTSRQLEDVVLMTSVRIEELNSERKDELGNLESIHAQLQENQDKYAAKLFSEIEAMKKDVEISSQKTKEYSEQVAKIKGEIAEILINDL